MLDKLNRLLAEYEKGSLLLKFLIVMTVFALVLSIMFLDLGRLKLKLKNKLKPPVPTPVPNPIEDIIMRMEKEGVLLKLDRSDSLAGIDHDHNGIRDDIDEYIQKTFTDEKQKKAVEQLARSYQSVLLVDLNDMNLINKTRENFSKSTRCLFIRFNDFDAGSDTMDNIKRRTINTKPRLEAYLNFSEALSGKVWGLPKGDTCDD